MINKKYIYISGILNNPIIKSQVMNWLEIIQDKGIVFDLMCCIPIHHILFRWKQEKDVLKCYRKLLHGSIFIVPIVRSKDSICLITPLIKYCFLFWYCIKHRSFNSIIIQSRTRFNYKPIFWIKKTFKKVKFIYDMRGAAAAEYLNSFDLNRVDELPDPKTRIKYQRLLQAEKKTVHLSDATFCVSQNLKQYSLNTGISCFSDKLHVFPGGADSSTFFYDKTLRCNERKSLGIETKTVCIYCGSLTHYWHKSDLIFEYASQAVKSISNLIFICLTKDLGIAKGLLNKYDIPEDRIICKYVNKADEINRYYNVADYGIILRDKNITNYVSSPTKVAEYLLAGLPLLMSDNIGDFSEVVKEFGYGVVSSLGVDDLIRYTETEFYRKIDRLSIAKYSMNKYSKQAIVEDLVALYKEI